MNFKLLKHIIILLYIIFFKTLLIFPLKIQILSKYIPKLARLWETPENLIAGANIYSISPLGKFLLSHPGSSICREPIFLGTAKTNLLPLEISLESPGRNFKFRQSLGNPIVKCKHKTAATEFCQCSLLLPPGTASCDLRPPTFDPPPPSRSQSHAPGSARLCYCY